MAKCHGGPRAKTQRREIKTVAARQEVKVKASVWLNQFLHVRSLFDLGDMFSHWICAGVIDVQPSSLLRKLPFCATLHCEGVSFFGPFWCVLLALQFYCIINQTIPFRNATIKNGGKACCGPVAIPESPPLQHQGH